MSQKTLSICYLPGRESTYVRTRVLSKGMRDAGLTVYDCSHNKKTFWRYFISFIKFLKFNRRCDVIFIGFFGQCLVPIVKLFTRKKIIFEAFLSAYQTLAFDRKSISPNGLRARIVKFGEKYSCKLADAVILDTNQHIEYYLDEYELDKQKFHRVFLGCDDSLMYPMNEPESEAFTVHFHGEFQALHGTKYITEAAKLLPGIKFRMVGKGRELDYCLQQREKYQINNLTILPPVKFNEIPKLINSASVCLGIFGETQKTQLVIPFKVYETMAMGKPTITADTPAIRELLTHKKDIYLCPAGDPKALAASIEELHRDEQLRKRIGENGYITFKEKCSPKVLGEQIQSIAKNLVENN